MAVATWTTNNIPAWHLEAGDRIDRNGHALTLLFAMAVDPGRTAYGTLGRTFNVDARRPVPVHVPDQPIDGYGLWRPLPGTWPYSGCTCVHRRNANGSWGPIGRDCPACTAANDWED